jgi:hypothetical protein
MEALGKGKYQKKVDREKGGLMKIEMLANEIIVQAKPIEKYVFSAVLLLQSYPDVWFNCTNTFLPMTKSIVQMLERIGLRKVHEETVERNDLLITRVRMMI